MDVNLRAFTVDDYLKRYTKALEHLAKCVEPKTFHDVLVYVKRHTLYRNAMQLYTKSLLWRECLNVEYSMSMSHGEITCLATRLADSLLERREFVDAARL